MKVLLTLYQNLESFTLFFPPSCLHGSITTLSTIALEYVSAFYPRFLIGVAYLCIELHDHNFKPLVWICRPFHKCFVKFKRYWDLHTSVSHAVATFLLLSYTKVTLVSFALLASTTLHNATELSRGWSIL